ncbi:transcriptional regulator [Schaalia hyovaginalis]|nr:transcriptional regulator [Schaalia hyovaginalis]
MSPTPPSFSPQPRKARPGSRGAKSLPKAPSPADQVERRALRDPSRAKPQAPRGPVLAPGEKPRVMGVAKDDAAPRQWRVDTGGDGLAPEPVRRLMPTTADQPSKEQPPSFAPKRLRELRGGASPRPGAGAPEAQASTRTAPPSYAPRSQQPGIRAQSAPSSRPRAQASAPQWRPAQAPVPPSPQRRPAARPPRKRPRTARRLLGLAALLLAALVAWVSFLVWDANGNLGRVNALSGAADTPGTTYLLAGSDSRDDGAVQDGFTDSARTDSIMLVNVAPNGQAAVVTIPRDTLVEIPDYGWDKINSSYALGGESLLVATVENLTGLTVDHYVQVGMGGVADIVDAVGGVNLCYEGDVTDDPSGLVWSAGCHDADGATALAFSRMRYSDPTGDIGRTLRQRQVISKVIGEAASPSSLLNPSRALRLERAGSRAFTVDESDSIIDVARLVLAFRSASGSGMMGTPPIAALDYLTDAGGMAVLLSDTTAPDFFAALRAGALTADDFNALPQ